MVKFFTTALVAVAASLGLASAADKVPCKPLSFVENQADFTSLNTIIDIIVQGNILGGYLGAVDPIAVANNRLDAVPFSVLGTDFTLTPVIQSLNVTGLKAISPRHLNVTGPTALDIGADIKGELALTGTLSFEIAQLNHQWWQICWTNILQPAKCPPAIVTVDLGASVQEPSVVTNANAAMVKCDPAAVTAGTCTDFTINDILLGALTGDFTTLLGRILRRVSSASLNSFTLDFSKINSLNFHFHSSGSLITELGKKLLAFSTSEINKKGDLYKALTGVVNKLVKTLLNQLITDKLAPQFGSSCYDA